MATVYTIGHSTRTLEQLVEALRAHEVEVLCDIRAFPASRRLPHFNREAMQESLPAAGIEYRWMRALGGRRGRVLKESPNTGLRNESFRNYADYMMTAEFRGAAAELVALAERRRAAIMCAEAVYWHCHRMLVSDYLVAHGNRVLHISNAGPVREHKMLAEAQVVEGELRYPGLFG